jgi:hypothetical protein
MTMNKTCTVIALAAAVTAGSLISSAADARTRHHHGYYGFRGAYGYAPIRVYGAEHYRRRPHNQDLNPDFELGGNRS